MKYFFRFAIVFVIPVIGSVVSAPVLFAQELSSISLKGSEGRNSSARNDKSDRLTVRVRAISASGALPSWERLNTAKLDSRMHDLSAKLASLPRIFASYSLLCERGGDVAYGRKRTLRLSNRHVVTVRALREGSERAVRVRWEDENGRGLLDTRVRYEPSTGGMQEPMVVGLDRGSDEGIILAIDLSE